MNPTLLRFLSVGVVNTVIGLGTTYFCMGVLRLGDALSNAIGYAIGVCCSFVLNKKWTFKHRGNVFGSLARFLLVFAVAYCANLAFVLFLINELAWNRYLAQAAGVFIYTAISYTGSRYFAFPQSVSAAAPQAPDAPDGFGEMHLRSTDTRSQSVDTRSRSAGTRSVRQIE